MMEPSTLTLAQGIIRLINENEKYAAAAADDDEDDYKDDYCDDNNIVDETVPKHNQ